MNLKFLFAAVVALAALAGCAGQPQGGDPQGNGQTVSFGAPFSATNGITYTAYTSSLHLRVLNFTDSRCPADVQCIWAGERGVDVQLYLAGDPALLLGTLQLRETTSPKATTQIEMPQYEVELVSIDTDANRAVLIVREAQKPEPANENEWFSFDPKQCGSNPWETWGLAKIQDYRNEEGLLKAWFSAVNGIEARGYASKRTNEIVCMSCSCPRGDRIAVLVDSKDSVKMAELGWAAMNDIACTKEAKLCADGSGVARQAPFCEFAECPEPPNQAQ